MEAGPWIIAVACIAYSAVRSYNEYRMWSDLACVFTTVTAHQKIVTSLRAAYWEGVEARHSD